MRLRRLRICFALSLVAVASGAPGCAATDNALETTRSSAPSEAMIESSDVHIPRIDEVGAVAPNAAQRERLASALGSLEAAPGYATTALLHTGSAVMIADFELSADGYSWTGSVKSSDLTINVVHKDSSSWISGPKDYWLGMGVPAEVADRVSDSGQFVSFSGESAAAIVASFNFTRLIQVISTGDIGRISMVSDDLEASDVLVFQTIVDNEVSLVSVTRSGIPKVISVASDPSVGVYSVIEVTALAQPPLIEAPAIDRIYTRSDDAAEAE
jgi:hypothetical protein